MVTTYDRSDLIERAIGTVKDKLIEEIIVVSIIILIFLWHIPSSIIPIVTIPVSVALAFIPLKLFGMNANLMSLAGIAISIGVLVDGAIVEVENAYNKIHHWIRDGKKGDFHQVRLEALLEVGPGRFLLAAGHRGRVHAGLHPGGSGRPALPAAGLLQELRHGHCGVAGHHARSGAAHAVRAHRSIHVPAAVSGLACDESVRGDVSLRGAPSDQPALHRLYEKPCRFVVRHAKATIAVARADRGHHDSGLPAASAPSSCRRCARGRMLYMPSAVQPGMSVAEAQKALQIQDKILMTFPEVERVFGKAGRANTSTDPAPFTMMETTIMLKPETQWRENPRWYSSLGAGMAQSSSCAPSGATASPRTSSRTR